MTPITADVVAAALAAQDIAVPPGRAERIAKGLAPLVGAVVTDARDLPFDVEAPSFTAILARCADA